MCSFGAASDGHIAQVKFRSSLTTTCFDGAKLRPAPQYEARQEWASAAVRNATHATWIPADSFLFELRSVRPVHYLVDGNEAVSMIRRSLHESFKPSRHVAQ